MASSSTQSLSPGAKSEARDFAFFDNVYNKRGKVQIIPEIKKPTAQYVVEAPPPSEYLVKVPHTEQFVLDEGNFQSPSVLSHAKADEAECDVLLKAKAALEKDMKPDHPPVFVLHNQFLGGTTKTGQSKEAGKTDKSQEAVKTDKSQEAGKTDKSQEAGKTDKSQEAVKTDKSQEAVKTDKSQKAGKADKSQMEKDVLVLHPTLGVLILKVKSISTKTFRKHFSKPTEVTKEFFDKATRQLLHAQTSIQEEMGDLLGKDAVILIIALPNLRPEDASVIREKLEREKFLVDHPEILLLCGSTDEVYGEWVKQLKERRASSGHAFQGISDEEREKNFQRACIRRFSVAGLRPGQSVKDSAALHRRFLLSEEKLRVRDSQAQLLHIWGPPGSCKTLLLADRARRWVSENKRVALAVWEPEQGALLHLLKRSVCGDRTDTARVSTYRSYRDLRKWLDTVSTEEPVYVIMDEVWPADLSDLLKHVTEGRVRGLWAACTGSLVDRDIKTLQELGGTTEQLEISFRCPPSVSTASNKVREERWEPPLQPPPVPLVLELGLGVEIISHPDHPQSQPWDECPTCRKKVEAFFFSLGLLEDTATEDTAKSALSLSDCVVLTTERDGDTERVAEWLQGLGLHAMADEMPRMNDVTPVLLPGETPESRDQPKMAAWVARLAEIAAWEARLATGTDREGKPVLHVVDWQHFQGLERAVVMVWHEDREDEDRDRQGQKDRDWRMTQHRRTWFRAMTRSLARVAVMATTPSPLLSSLPASSPTVGQVIPSPSSSGAVTTRLSPASRRTPSDSTTPPD